MLYRYNIRSRVWTKDVFSHLYSTSGTIYPVLCYYNNTVNICEVHNSTNKQYVQDFNVYTDGGIYSSGTHGTYTGGTAYTTIATTKYFDLSLQFNFKKLRRLYVIARLQNEDIPLAIAVKADAAVALDPEVGTAVVDPYTHVVTWSTTTVPNFNFYAGTYPLSNWILGINPLGDSTLSVLKTNIRAKCRRVQLTFEHTSGTPCEIYGFGLEFRAKRP